ncbi:MAG: cellulase family glycosylhydrolase [Candidatus Omnitrophota bacterium]
MLSGIVNAAEKTTGTATERNMPFLRVTGGYIVNSRGEDVLFRGINFGNWLLWEGGSLGIPNYAEHILRNKMEAKIEKKKVDLFFELIRKYHTTKEDFITAKAEGLNVIRLCFHYRYVKEKPTELDQAVRWAKWAGIYIILNHHAAPGSQAPAYFADSDGTARLWDSPEYQEEYIKSWEILAERYRDEPAVAGYEILNEPAGEGWKVTDLYKRTVARIRKIDRRHIIFLDGNSYAGDPSVLDPPFDDNVVYMCHHYEESVDEMDRWIHKQGWITFRDKYKVPIMCSEYHFNRGCDEYFEREGIHWSPWIHQKLSDRWRKWIENTGRMKKEKRGELRNIRIQFVNKSELSDGIKMKIVNFLNDRHPGDMNEFFRNIAKENSKEQLKLKSLRERFSRMEEDYWIDSFADTINKMSEEKMEEFIKDIRDRTGRQFTSDGFRYGD